MPSTPGDVRVTVTDYSPEKIQTQVIDDFEDFIIQHRPDWVAVRWVNVDGITDMNIIRGLAEKYDLHPLAVEDVLHVGQRPKTEAYPARGEIHGRLFVVARQVQMVDGHPEGEQVSIFVGHKTVVTIQEKSAPLPGEETTRKNDVFDPIRTRLQSRGSRVRTNDASFLLYSLLDSIIDHVFPILEYYSERLEEIEDEVLTRPTPATIQQIHQVKRELLQLRRAAWPMREVISTLIREQHECLSETTRTYFRDVYDHTVQIIDMVETYREFASGLTETYMTALSEQDERNHESAHDHHHDLRASHVPGRGLWDELRAYAGDPVGLGLPDVLGNLRRDGGVDALLVPPSGLAVSAGHMRRPA